MLERLSVFDASLLSMETPSTPLHLGGLGIFHPGLTFGTVAEVLSGRLHQIPLARRRLLPGGFGGRPVWVDDPDFDLSYHLRHAALPAPGDKGQLGEFLARVQARQLDRNRPLWELYVIEGIEGGRTALFRKVHLAMAGGDAGDPFALLLDDTPEPAAMELPEGERSGGWRPRPLPRRSRLAVEALRDRAEQAAAVARAARSLAAEPPGRLAAAAVDAAGSAAGLVSRIALGAPRSPLNRPLTPHRRIAMARVSLEDLRTVRRVFGGSVNDVVVAVAADAVGRLLRWRGFDTKDLDLRVMVPVRVHGGEAPASTTGMAETRTVGDGVVGVLAPLPVMEMDPVARLYRIMGELAGLKESRQAVAADALVRVAGWGPSTLHAMAARLASGEQRYNVALSNAPGPQSPRYLAGVELAESYPMLPLTGDCSLSIAVSSYAGVLCFGFVGDRDAMEDIELLEGFTAEAVAELRQAADEAAARQAE